MVNDKIKKENLNKIIKKLEGMKKKSYSSSELRNKNQLMNRLDRIQDRELNRKISLKQKELKNKKFIPAYDLDNEDKDLLDMFGIQKKKKVQKHRGGFLSFVR